MSREKYDGYPTCLSDLPVCRPGRNRQAQTGRHIQYPFYICFLRPNCLMMITHYFSYLIQYFHGFWTKFLLCMLPRICHNNLN